MKTTVIYITNYHVKEDVKAFFNNNYAIFVKGRYYPTMNYHISDNYCDGYRVEFTADNKNTAIINYAIDSFNKSVYECEI